MLIDSAGNICVRAWDFDRSGADIPFFRSYWQFRDLPTTAGKWQEFFDTRYAALLLPPPDWQFLPTVPGPISTQISIESPEPRMRLIKVEGMGSGEYEGRTGYWQMHLPVDDMELEKINAHRENYSWVFIPTDLSLSQPIVDKGPVRLSQPRGPHLFTTLWNKPLEIPAFDLRSDRLPVIWNGQPTTLYTIDGLRQWYGDSELTDIPRLMGGAIEIDGQKKPVTMLVSKNWIFAA